MRSYEAAVEEEGLESVKEFYREIAEQVRNDEKGTSFQTVNRHSVLDTESKQIGKRLRNMSAERSRKRLRNESAERKS